MPMFKPIEYSLPSASYVYMLSSWSKPAIHTVSGTMNLVEDGFYDPGQLRPGTQFQTLEDYLKEPVNDKRPIFFINGKVQ